MVVTDGTEAAESPASGFRTAGIAGALGSRMITKNLYGCAETPQTSRDQGTKHKPTAWREHVREVSTTGNHDVRKPSQELDTLEHPDRFVHVTIGGRSD